MSKIKLGQAPKTFKSKVIIPLIDGSDASIEMVFKYRTKTQYGALVDELMTTAEKAVKSKDKTVEGAFKSAIENNVEFIFKIAEGWDLEDEFNAENLSLLDDEYQGAITAIGEAYRSALVEGKVKN